MEIGTYINFLRKRWKIILFFTLATFAATAFWTYNTKPVYESTATYVVRISSSSDEKNRISALNTLMSSDDIPATYAKVANSRLIKQQAVEQLALSSAQRAGLSSDSQLIAGTNVLEVTARGYDPTLVMNYANAVGGQMVVFVETLYDTFELAQLDEATLPRTPSYPDTTMNLIMGGAFGFFLGLVLAFLVEYLQPVIKSGSLEGSHLGVTNLLHPSELLNELEKEMGLAKASRRPVSFALLDLTFPESRLKLSAGEQRFAAQEVASVVARHLQKDDKISLFEEKTVAFLLPDTSQALANAKLTEWHQAIKNAKIEIGTLGETRINSTWKTGTFPLDPEQENLSAHQILQSIKDEMVTSKRSAARAKNATQNPAVTG